MAVARGYDAAALLNDHAVFGFHDFNIGETVQAIGEGAGEAIGHVLDHEGSGCVGRERAEHAR